MNRCCFRCGGRADVCARCQVAANQKALKEATAVREKEAAEFNEDDRDMLQSIQATVAEGCGGSGGRALAYGLLSHAAVKSSRLHVDDG